MPTVAPGVHNYLSSSGVVALTTTPMLMKNYLGEIASGDPIWDYRPSEDRFTLKEALAHIADWNEVFENRIRRTLTEDNPMLPDRNESQIAIDRNYIATNGPENLERFCQTRPALVEAIRGITANDWARTAIRESVGQITLDQLLIMIMGHDAYHVKQVVEYLDAAALA